MKPIGATFAREPSYPDADPIPSRAIEKARGARDAADQVAGDLRQLHHCPCGDVATWRCLEDYYCVNCVPCGSLAMDEDGDPPDGYDYRSEGWEVTP